MLTLINFLPKKVFSGKSTEFPAFLKDIIQNTGHHVISQFIFLYFSYDFYVDM